MSNADIVVSGAISRAPLADPGLDYNLLIAEGITLVQHLSGTIWTDYNYSDPGVTTLEQLCYALTELSYRADFPVADLLGEPGTGRIALAQQALFPARAIAPVNPVTIADLRRLIIDRVPDIGNAWFVPLLPADAQGVNGLYRIMLLVPGLDPGCDDHGPDPDAVRAAVADCYVGHRALCEDVAEITILEPLATSVQAEVQLDDRADPDVVLAQLLFRIGLTLAPEPRRDSLDMLRDLGKTTTEIFDGPLMLRGFIADDQLSPFRDAIKVEDVQAVMAETPGVIAVDRLAMRVAGDAHLYHPDCTISVPPHHILWLDTALRGGRFTIRLLHGRTVCRPNPARVKRQLDRLWAGQRRKWQLWADYAADYRPPDGAGSDLAAYASVQTQFPAVYGIGHYGLPPEASPKRLAQARQLKGYLMVFDQLMADFFAQLAFVRTLFSVSVGGDSTYASQSLRRIVPDAEALLRPDYDIGLHRLVAANDPVRRRQDAIVDFLLSIYAETLELPSAAGCGDGRRGEPQQALIKAKQSLLTRLVPATRDRGRGFDYRRGDIARQQTGLQIRCRIELALLDSKRRRGPEAVTEDDDTDFGTVLPAALATMIADQFLPVESGADTAALAPITASPLADRRVAASLLAALADPARYRVGQLSDSAGISLVAQAVDGRWWLLGVYNYVADAVAATDALGHAAEGDDQRLYIVEWVLLRHARQHRGDDDHHWPASAFDFRITAVMPARDTVDDSDDDDADDIDRGWRSSARAIVRANTPAHVVVEDRFLEPDRLRRFFRLHNAWTAALRHGHSGRIAETSWHLARFLDRQEAENTVMAPPVPVPPAAPVVDGDAHVASPLRSFVQSAEAVAEPQIASFVTFPGPERFGLLTLPTAEPPTDDAPAAMAAPAPPAAPFAERPAEVPADVPAELPAELPAERKGRSLGAALLSFWRRNRDAAP